MPNSPRSHSRLSTLLLVLFLCYICTRSTNGSKNEDLGNIEKTALRRPGGTSYVRQYYLVSRCSERFVRIKLKRGKTSPDAWGRTSKAKLRFESWGHEGMIQIIGEHAQRYLCFNQKGRLITRTNPPRRNPKQCVFKEEMVDNHIMLQNQEQPLWYVGFNRRGRKMRGYQARIPRKRKCFMFTKIDPSRPDTGGYKAFLQAEFQGALESKGLSRRGSEERRRRCEERRRKCEKQRRTGCKLRHKCSRQRNGR